MKEKKEVINLRLFLIFLLLIIIPFVSASFFNIPNIREVDLNNFNIRNLITGMGTTATTSLNLTIGNTPPTVSNVSSPGTISVSAGTFTWVNFSFVATDIDGVTNINDSSASGRFNISAATVDDRRFNSSCALVGDIDTTQANYSCNIQMWYFDPNGVWIINASIKDNSGAYAQNFSSFTIGLTTAMNMTPNALNWSSVGPTSTNVLANQNITVFNIANKNITASNINVTAADMQGETTTTEYLNASNFTVSTRNACDTGNVMISSRTINISTSNVTVGNVTSGIAREELFFCLEEVTAGISQQSYSTTGTAAWTVGVV